MNYITVNYTDAMRLNEILYSSYIAEVVNLTQTPALISQFQTAFSDNQIILNDEEQGWLDALLTSELWNLTLGQAMIYVYQLRQLIPVPEVYFVETPFKLNIITYLTGWSDGTYSYFNLFYADPLQMQTLPVTDLLIQASNDPNISLANRNFIKSFLS